ncbi:MAG: type II toxin-antitoxin system HicA family toxin [Alphaproteobacteria bacterium]|nr:type II toxin-antitoxin system HicA family toxin [Alphaproteobacteria bacterium]
MKEIFCKHASFFKEAQDICGEQTLGKLRRAMTRNGWEETGQGKGGHIQYKKDGINERITLVSRNHDSEKVHKYVPEQIRDIYARAFPQQFDDAIVERARAKVCGKPENYVVAAAIIPQNQRA